jgi:hypothetical protein
MALHLRRAADQCQNAGWPRENDHLVVMSGQVVMGSIKQVVGGPSANHWTWSITCVHIPPGQSPMFGVEGTREEAQESLARAWRRWLGRAGLKETA